MRDVCFGREADGMFGIGRLRLQFVKQLPKLVVGAVVLFLHGIAVP